MRSIKWCNFQWPWTNPNPVFKVTPLCDAKYLTNGYRYGHGYYRRRIGNRDILCAQLTSDLFAIAKYLLWLCSLWCIGAIFWPCVSCLLSIPMSRAEYISFALQEYCMYFNEIHRQEVIITTKDDYILGEIGTETGEQATKKLFVNINWFCGDVKQVVKCSKWIYRF